MDVRLINKAQVSVESTKKIAPYILVFKTNIRLRKDLKKIEPVLNANPFIINWNIDRNDSDKVLRIKTVNINSGELIDIIKGKAIYVKNFPIKK